jgi:hypothetical protein
MACREEKQIFKIHKNNNPTTITPTYREKAQFNKRKNNNPTTTMTLTSLFTNGTHPACT